MRLSEFVQPFIAEQEQRYPLTPEGRISATQEAVWRLLYSMNPATVSVERIYPEEAAFRDALEPVDWSVTNPDPEVKDDADSIAAVRARIRGTDCVFQGITSSNSEAMADLFA